MIELKHWRSLRMLIEERNMRRAADRLGMTQPSLTKQLQLIEGRLGVTLFDRTREGLDPRAPLVENIAAVDALLAAQERLVRAIQESAEEAPTTLRFAALEYVMRAHLPRILALLAERLPDTSVEVTSLAPPAAVRAVAEQDADLGLAVAPVLEESLMARTLVKGTWTLMVRDDHPAAHQDAVALADLHAPRLMLFARTMNEGLFDRLAETIAATAPESRIVYQVNDPSVAPEMVMNDVGAFIVASYARPDTPHPVSFVPISDLNHRPELQLTWRREGMSPALRTLIDTVVETVRDV